MKRFLLILTICLLSVVAVCAVACTQSAQAATMDGYVRYNAIICDSPLKWSYSLSGVSSYTQLETDRGLLYLGRGGSSIATLQNNVLTSSILSTSGQYVYLDFKIDRETLINLIGLYNTYYGLSLPNKVSFTVNLDVLSAYYIIQCWGRNSINGGANATVALSPSVISGISTLTLDLDTYNYTYYSFLVQTYGSVQLNGVKLEPGNNSFTGFVYDDFRDNGFDYGFQFGFDEGKKVYSTRSFTFDFNDVTPGAVPSGTVTYTKGWIDLFNFTSGNQLADISISYIPAWFTYKNYTILSSGFILLSSQNDPNVIDGIMVYVSPEANVTPSSNDFTILSYLMIFDTYSQFTIIDPSLPSSWNPVTYPYLYQLSGFAQLGYNEFLELLQNTYYGQGFTDGKVGAYAEGYNVGLAKGYTDGLQTATNGSWQSLMSALVDIPVTAVTSLLDFDFLGFNMLNLAKLLLTLTLFFFVLNILVGKVKGS